MKLVIVLCLVAAVVAAPPPAARVRYSPDNAQLLSYDNDNDGLGNYKYGFEQSDGTKQQQQGELRNQGQENEYVAVKGSFTWVGPDNVVYQITYTADENGYQPEIEQGPGGALSPAALASLIG